MYKKQFTVLNLSQRIFLRKKSTDFPSFDQMSEEDLQDLKNLTDTFNILQGYGLALPQIGVHKRAVVVNLQALGLDDESPLEVMINPSIETWGGEQKNEEACFSVPHISARVRRPMNCRVDYTGEDGVQKTLELEGFPAACLQHEVDHLDGTLYIDKVGSAFRSMLMKKVMKIEKAIRKKKEEARLEFEREHREIYGTPKKKTTSSKKRNKVRKKRPRRSKKK